MIPLCKTPAQNQFLKFPGLFPPAQFNNRPDALFLGVPDKAAGIHHRNICLFLIVRKRVSSVMQLFQHDFRVYQILVTSK